jgi:hypothetical protein
MLALVAEAKKLEQNRETKFRTTNDGGEFDYYGKETVMCPVANQWHKHRVWATFNNNFECAGDSDYLVAAWNNYTNLARAVEVLVRVVDQKSRCIGEIEGVHTAEYWFDQLVCDAVADIAAGKDGGE